MLRFAVSKVATTVALRPAVCAAARRAAAATAVQQQQLFSSLRVKEKDKVVKVVLAEEEEVVKVVLADSLEWALSSPPPIHQFDEPPIVVEIAEA